MFKTKRKRSFDLEINDCLEELKDENNRLLNEVLFSRKLIQLFNNYRNCLNNCICNENKVIFNELENKYKTILYEEKQSEINRFYSKTITQNEIQLNKNNINLKEENFSNNCLDIKREQMIIKQEIKEEVEKTFVNNNEEINCLDIKREQMVIKQEIKEEMDESFVNNNEEIIRRDELLSCEYPNCSFHYKDSNLLREHIRQSHIRCKTFNCLKCEKSFETSIECDFHSKVFHTKHDLNSKETNINANNSELNKSESESDLSEKQLECEECGHVFDSRTQKLILEKHLKELKKSLLKAKAHKFVRSQTRLINNIKTEISAVNNELKSIHSRLDLNSHKIIINGNNNKSQPKCDLSENQYKCRECGYVFDSRTQKSMLEKDLKELEQSLRNAKYRKTGGSRTILINSLKAEIAAVKDEIMDEIKSVQ